jgi:prepilin-type N-terminal cleavage/methylation domain-containing protein
MRRAFTLVELLVVVAIIGLLSSVAVVALSQTSINARNQQRRSNLMQVAKALELYYSANDSYPTTSGVWLGNCSDYASRADTGATGWIPNLAPTYIGTLPHDPNSGKANAGSPLAYCRTSGAGNCYLYNSNGTDYKALAHCTPEGTLSSSDPYVDSVRSAYSFAVYSVNAKTW